jgi:hypothetical protein
MLCLHNLPKRAWAVSPNRTFRVTIEIFNRPGNWPLLTIYTVKHVGLGRPTKQRTLQAAYSDFVVSRCRDPERITPSASGTGINLPNNKTAIPLSSSRIYRLTLQVQLLEPLGVSDPEPQRTILEIDGSPSSSLARGGMYREDLPLNLIRNRLHTDPGASCALVMKPRC